MRALDRLFEIEVRAVVRASPDVEVANGKGRGYIYPPKHAPLSDRRAPGDTTASWEYAPGQANPLVSCDRRRELENASAKSALSVLSKPRKSREGANSSARRASSKSSFTSAQGPEDGVP